MSEKRISQYEYPLKKKQRNEGKEGGRGEEGRNKEKKEKEKGEKRRGKKERDKEWDRRNISRNNSQDIPKFDERHKFTDSRSLSTPQQD